ncbi:MAG TPA: 50S ribosomal protein L13 [Dehalococcoidia bacterium]|nr:50S ribosomal protein L13 [Dehalococcoidia bacterium]
MTALKKGRRIRGPKTSRLRESEIAREWRIIDVANRPLGRVASEIARILLGKDKATFEPHLVMGDYVIVINAAEVVLTGNKMNSKKYYRHTGYPGGIRERTFDEQMQRDPARVIEKAVKGMLPSGARGYELLRSLKVYAGTEHPHQGQIGQIIRPNKFVPVKKVIPKVESAKDETPQSAGDLTDVESNPSVEESVETPVFVRLTRAVSAYKRAELDTEAGLLGIELESGWKKDDVYQAIQAFYGEHPLEGE